MFKISILACMFSGLVACNLDTPAVSESSSAVSTPGQPASTEITAEEAANLGLIEAMQNDQAIHPNIEYCSWSCDMGPTCVGWAHAVEHCCYSGTCWTQTSCCHYNQGCSQNDRC